MMVERNSTARRAHRAQTASPYARPSTAPKKSSWFSGLLSWIKSPPTRNELDEDEEEEEENQEWTLPQTNPAARALAQRGHDIAASQGAAPRSPLRDNQQSQPPLPSYPQYRQRSADTIQPPPQPIAGPSTSPPMRRSVTSPLPDTATDAERYQVAINFLENKKRTGDELNAVEVAGLQALLTRGALPAPTEEDDEKREPFRFSTSVSREASPSGPGAAGPSTAANGAPEKPRMLKKNPNGTYRWNGGGSSRPNRYQSPGFGTSRSPPKLNLTPEKPAGDAKRRRVGEHAETSTSQRAGPSAPPARSDAPANGVAPAPMTNGTSKPGTSAFPAKSPSPTRQSQPAASTSANSLAPPATPRLRTTGLNKPTAPAVPSPLRQTWGNSSDGGSPPVVRPTRAANVMTELIKEATPPKAPVFVNPYEAQYPGSLKDVVKNKTLARRKSREEAKAKAEAAKAAAAAQKKAEESKVKDDDLSPRKIIEATVPKGAKRARPPPELTTQKPEAPAADAGLRRSARLKSPEPPSAPTTQNFFAFGAPAKQSPTKNALATVEEVSDDEDEQPSPSKKPKNQVPKFGAVPTPKPSAAPAPAAKLSATFAPAPTPAPAATPTPASAPTSAPTPAPASAPAPAPLLPSAFPRPQDPARTILVEEVDDKAMESESTSVVHPSQVIEPAEEPSRRSQSPTSPATPTLGSNPFSSGKGAFPVKSSAPKAPSKLRYSIQPEERDEAEEKKASEPASVEEEQGPKSAAEVKDWVKGLATHELPTFAFDIPSATPGAGPSTLKAREDAKAAPAAELPTYALTVGGPAPAAFDWAAAGVKKAAAAAGGGEWTCGLCGLKCPDSAKDKCTICEAPRPGAAPKAPTQGFDWAAAGVKPPPKDDAAGWTCSACALKNPASATDKCTVCEEPRPAAKPAAPATQGFNWAAAGMKQPEAAPGKWQCSMCACMSPAEATKCTVCDEPR